MFNPAQASEQIKEEYIDYICTRYHFNDPVMGDSFRRELTRMMSKGPYLDIKDPFKTSLSIRELIAEGVLSGLFNELEAQKPAPAHGKYKRKLPITRPLYTHQEAAIRHITAGHNAVITTGTGSGKTECFLIPVLNELLREREKGTLPPGVRAILIYPMNALANDQMKRLREILMCYSEITFGVYNGETQWTQREAVEKYRALHETEDCEELRQPLKNEIISREAMQQTPPHILCTNYAMLEHLLLRPNDDLIFSNSDFKFVILDEAHIYRGATGMETALLLRRLKARMRSTREAQFILTSATLGERGRAEDSIVRFAERLTGAQFRAEDIVFGEREERANPSRAEIPTALFSAIAACEKPECLPHIFREYGFAFNAGIPVEENLYDLCAASTLYQDMRARLKEEHARKGPDQAVLLSRFAELLGLSEKQAIELIHVCTQAQKNGKVLIDARYHFFVRTLEGAYMIPGRGNEVYLERKARAENGSGTFAGFEISMCQNCGDIAFVGRESEFDRNGIRYLLPASRFEDVRYFGIAREGDQSPDEETEYDELPVSEEDEGAEDDEDSKDSSFLAGKVTYYYLCTHCGAISPEEDGAARCGCNTDGRLRLREHVKQNARCSNCLNGSYYRFYLGSDAATAVLATSLFESLPAKHLIASDELRHEWEGGKQFLSFSDSRSEAAFFAPYLKRHYQEFLRRRGLIRVLTLKKADILSGDYMAHHLAKDLESLFFDEETFVETLNPNQSYSPRDLKAISHRHAWMAVLNAMLTSNTVSGLTSLGSLQFRYLGNYAKVGAQTVFSYLAAKYSVDELVMEALLNMLIDTVVAFGAISTPESGDLEADDRKYVFYQDHEKVLINVCTNNAKSYHLGWLPRNRKGDSNSEHWYPNQRLSLVMAALNCDKQCAKAFLEEYLEILKSPGNHYRLKRGKGEFYTIPAEHFEVLIPGDPRAAWCRCARCGRVSRHGLNGKCGIKNCGGALERFAPEELQHDNHYVKLYRKQALKPLLIQEHTAQLSKEKAQQYQLDFEKNYIHALSCSTTFEMGVDVGELETVFLRDVPPSAANYAQRAGRAGRSNNSAAYALTFAKLSSHDLTFYGDPNLMISGRILPPVFKVDNRKIVLRHVYAVVLGYFFRQDSSFFNDNRAENLMEHGGLEALRVLLARTPDALTRLLARSFGKELDDELGISQYRFVDEFVGEVGVFTKMIEEYQQTVAEYNKIIDDAYKNRNSRLAEVQEKRLRLFRSEQTIGILARHSVLPKYGFPVDTAELRCYDDGKETKAKDLQLQRDLSMAISEYAPGAKTVADNHMYTSRYIRQSLVKKGTYSYHYGYVCLCPYCQTWNFSETLVSEPRACIGCGEMLEGYRWSESIEPRAGFLAEERIESIPMTKPDRSYHSDESYIGNNGECLHIRCTIGERRIDLRARKEDEIIVTSKKNFYVCKTCGYALSEEEATRAKRKSGTKKSIQGAKTIELQDKHVTPFGSSCANQILWRERLHHRYKTDVVRMEFDVALFDDSSRLSMMYALLNAISKVLDIERLDISACLEHGKDKFTIIFYDAVPGGAGHVRRILEGDGEALTVIIEAAYVAMDQCGCDTSCYNCLRSYSNQKWHDGLDRHLAKNYLANYRGNCSEWSASESSTMYAVNIDP